MTIKNHKIGAHFGANNVRHRLQHNVLKKSHRNIFCFLLFIYVFKMSQRSKSLTSLVYKPDSVWPNRKRLSIYEQDSCALSHSNQNFCQKLWDDDSQKH